MSLEVCIELKEKIDESLKLIRIFESVSSLVIVLNKFGKLDICNKSIETTLGVKTTEALEEHYSKWL
jgi:transcriptional regulator with PAS, ATPase and Fis domain